MVLACPIPSLCRKTRQLCFCLNVIVLMMSMWNTYAIRDATLMAIYKNGFIPFLSFQQKTQRGHSLCWLYGLPQHLVGLAEGDGPHSCQAQEDPRGGMLHWSPSNFVFLLIERLAGVCQYFIIIWLQATTIELDIDSDTNAPILLDHLGLPNLCEWAIASLTEIECVTYVHIFSEQILCFPTLFVKYLLLQTNWLF